MIVSNPHLSLKHEVDAGLAKGIRSLRFTPAIEAQYEDETRKSRGRLHVIVGLISLVIFDVFLITDLTMVPDIFDLAVLVRLGIVTPIALGISYLVWCDPHPVVREAAISFIAPLVTGAILFLMLMSEAPLRQYQHTGIVLVMLFPTIAQGVQFRFAVGALLACLALYVGAVLNVQEMPPAVKQSAIMLLGGATMFMILSAYRTEWHARRFYLIGLRDRLRHAELATMSKTDPMTGLLNRRALDETLDAIWAKPDDAATPTAILVLDIDHFKSFNDRYGHLQGDRCIQAVARIAAGELRSEKDIAVRFGGEELVFVLPEADAREAAVVAERMRTAVERAAILHEAAGACGVVTVSIGIASAIPSRLVGPQEVILGADTALYCAKRNGRNQIFPPRSPLPAARMAEPRPPVAEAAA